MPQFFWIGLLGLLATTGWACQPALPADSPNVIYILADDLGYHELGSYGQSLIRTPHLNQLAREGMRFTQHYAGSAVCAPSRCTLLTGQHTGRSYVRGNHELGGFRDEEEGGQLPLPAGTPTLARMFQDLGYATACIGKWGLGGPDSEGLPTRQGFDFFYGYLCQKQAHNYYPTHLWRNESWDSLPNPYVFPHQTLPEKADPDDPASYTAFRGQAYAQDLMAREALRFVREQADNRFFLYLPFPVPHLSLQVPDDDTLRRYQAQLPDTPYRGDKGYLPNQTPRATYAAMITRMDAQIGQLLDLLDSLNLREETLIFFSSDNGTTFDIGGVDRHFFQSLGQLRGHKTNLWEGGIRVPFLASWPGHIPAGSVSSHISAFWDVWPTLSELTGGAPPPAQHGISFLPELYGDSTRQPKAEFLYWEFPERQQMQALRQGRWKAVRDSLRGHPGAPIQLYNLEQDPGETRDLASEYPEVVARLSDLMERAHTPHPLFPLGQELAKTPVETQD
ncbi:MAG: N-acetylgalactosamine-6-sulfatase [Bacteroidetes bacterium]|nr:MAG: N-acetylgalactosamine-6-sulfatase [Bacteroidota bacterium]